MSLAEQGGTIARNRVARMGHSHVSLSDRLHESITRRDAQAVYGERCKSAYASAWLLGQLVSCGKG